MTDTQSTDNAALLHLDGLNIVPRSVVVSDGVEFALAISAGRPHLAVLAPRDAPILTELDGEHRAEGERTLLVGATDAHNIAVLREHLPWLRAQPLGLR